MFYDKERELGSFLAEHQEQLAGDWNAEVIYPLKEAIKSSRDRTVNETHAMAFLDKKENMENPTAFFTAYMCRHYYWENNSLLGSENKANSFEEKAILLTKSFQQELKGTKWSYHIDKLLNKIQYSVAKIKADEDMSIHTWHLWEKQHIEYVVISDSYYPATLSITIGRLELLYCSM